MNSVFLFLSLAAVFLSSVSNASDPVLRADLRAWQADFASDRLCAAYLRKVERSGSLRDQVKQMATLRRIETLRPVLPRPRLVTGTEGYTYSSNGRFAVTLKRTTDGLNITRRDLSTGEEITKTNNQEHFLNTYWVVREISEDGSTVMISREYYENRSGCFLFFDFNEAKVIHRYSSLGIIQSTALSPRGNHAAFVWSTPRLENPGVDKYYLTVIENLRGNKKRSVEWAEHPSTQFIKITYPRFASTDDDEKFHLFFGAVSIHWNKDRAINEVGFHSHVMGTNRRLSFRDSMLSGTVVLDSDQNVQSLLEHSTTQQGMVSKNGERFVSLSILNQAGSTQTGPQAGQEAGSSPVIHAGKIDGSQLQKLELRQLSTAPVNNIFLTRENRVLVVFRDRTVHLLSSDNLQSIWSGSFDGHTTKTFFNDQGKLVFLSEESNVINVEETNVIFGSPKTL